MKFCNVESVYFVGIGGVGMSSLAQHLHHLGKKVAGSDNAESAITEKLQKMGIDVTIGIPVDVGNAQLVVRTSAVDTSHPQIQYAVTHNIPVLLREELLGQIFDEYPTRIAVCGTHGKTTVTAMIHHVLQQCNVCHTSFIGGMYQNNNYCFGNDVVIAEACEYNQSFLYLHPTVTLCTNVEFDHPDCFENKCAVEQAFCKLFEQSQQVILPQDCLKLFSNGICFDGKFSAQSVTFDDGKPCFDLYCDGSFVQKVYLAVTGNHNVQNALATITLCQHLGIDLRQILQAICTFEGVDRRWTIHPTRANVICDYAHHPTEIANTLATAKGIAKGKIVCIFQPHTYTRTRAFFRQFATVFEGVTVVYLPIYPAREKPLKNVTSKKLRKYAKLLGVDAHYERGFVQAKNYVNCHTNPTDLVLILGAGDIIKLFYSL